MSQQTPFALTSHPMPPSRRPPTPKGRRGANPAAQGGRARRSRPNKRKIVALCILIILPLVIIGGVLGSVGSGSSSKDPSGDPASSAPGIDLIVQACLGMSTLAQNAGSLAGTTSTTTGAGTSPTTGRAGTTTSTDPAAATTNLLAQMQQIAQLAANAAGTNSAWQPMATDISKLNDMLQADSGDDAAFSSQLDVVAQECSAVVGSNPPTSTGG
jgi:hypothetical protein